MAWRRKVLKVNTMVADGLATQGVKSQYHGRTLEFGFQYLNR